MSPKRRLPLLWSFALSDLLISIEDLWSLVGTAAAPRLVDVRRRTELDTDSVTLPAAVWRDADLVEEWADEMGADEPVVLACRHGGGLSQRAAAALRRRGFDARTLAGGIEGWIAAGRTTTLRSGLVHREDGRPSRWVTRVRPKIDRIACPWLIRRFIDRDAEFYFVEPSCVLTVAKDLDGIAYDIDGVEMSHVGPLCTFDTLLETFRLDDPSLAVLAMIVRGADTARLDLAPEAAGLLAISVGISALSNGDDHAALARGFTIYDALFAWQRYASTETHNWPVRSG